MPYLDDVYTYHSFKKDGTPTDTPHPHKKKRLTPGNVALGIGIAATAIAPNPFKKVVRRRFDELSDNLHNFKTPNSSK